MIRRTLPGAVVGAAAFGSLLAAPTRTGEINSCARVPAFLLSDHKGVGAGGRGAGAAPPELSRPAIAPVSRVVALATLIVVRIAAEAVTPTGISRTLS